MRAWFKTPPGEMLTGALVIPPTVFIVYSWRTDPAFFENSRAWVALIGSPLLFAAGCYAIFDALRTWHRGDDPKRHSDTSS